MRILPYILFMFLLFLATNNSSFAQQLIAYYPLNSDANDSTGTNAPMTLTNTPFQDGGIYCNGIYSGSGDPNYCDAITPQLTNLNMNSFSISAYFKVIDTLTDLHPVFVCGFAYRWLAFYLSPDSTVLLNYNNNNFELSTLHYTSNQWHRAKITYEDSIVNLYLDDSLAISKTVHLIHGNDKDIEITDYGSGLTFKGVFRDLRIYNLDSAATDIKTLPNGVPAGFSLYQNYPNPFNPTTKISWQSPVSSRQVLKVFNVLGSEVATLINEEKEAGYYSIDFNAHELPSGVYFYQLRTGSFIETKKMVLMK